MKIKLSNENSITVTKLMVQRFVFITLSLAAVLFICRRTVPNGKKSIVKLDSELQSVSFAQEKVSVYVGDSLNIQPVIVPENVDMSYTWELMDDGILTVNSGKITAENSGETTLGVRVGDKTAHIKVISKYKPLPPDSTLPPMYYDKLMIANYKNSLSADYVPENLIKIPSRYVAENYGALYATQETLDAYIKLYNDMYSAVQGNMHIISAYRSYSKQTELYNKAVQGYISAGYNSTDARAKALDTTQTPGNSEHQLGTTIDVSNNNTTNHNYHNTPAGAWLAANAHKYGFIIRYPADKEDITRIDYEPWHIRYVGVYHATYMYVNNLCLEEYIELQNRAREEAENYAESHPALEEYIEFQ